MSFTSNIEITKSYPAVLYNAGEALADYHEDHEINGAFWHAVNAQYNESGQGSWTSVDHTQASYATVQNPDGSISYFTQPATSGSWATSAWRGVIPIAASAGVGVVIAGVSGQTELAQQAVNDIFDVSGAHGGQGVRFRDLRLSYASNTFTTSPIAINVSGSDAVTCERVYFHNCPVAFETDTHSEFCGLLDCWIDYNAQSGGQPLNNQTMISLGGSEDFVTNCVIYQVPGNPSRGGPTGCTGIVLASNNNAHCITNTHITDFAIGISLEGTGSEGLAAVYVSDVVINAVQNAVVIESGTAGYLIFDVHFTGCTFAAANDAVPGTSGVVINVPSGGSSSDVAGIYFTGCSAYGWGNAGIEIDAGQNVVVTGGQYSSNGQSATTPSLGAGIVVAGGSDVTIVGADCTGVNELWKNIAPNPPPPPQLYGISLYPASGNVTNVTISGCNLNNNKNSGLLVTASGSVLPSHVFVRGCDVSQYPSYSSAISVASSVTNAQHLEITDCSGYNDQAPTLYAPAAPPTGIFYNTTFSYYGPIAFYVWGTATTTTITVGTLLLGLQTGSFNLPCNVGGAVTHTGPTAPTFAAIGM